MCKERCELHNFSSQLSKGVNFMSNALMCECSLQANNCAVRQEKATHCKIAYDEIDATFQIRPL